MNPLHDDRLLHRYLDGELSEAESAAFAARMLAEGELRERVDAEQRLRRAFADVARAPTPRAPAGFAANVLGEVRRLPARAELEQQEVAAGARIVCRRLLLAALVVVGVGALWHVGLLDRSRAGSVEASPAKIQQELERLDQLILEADGTDAADPRRGRRGR